eukprot:8321533-Heterocapsa_arctica.AAC.1
MSRRDVYYRPKNERGKDELHWLAQRDHRPDSLEPSPGKWNAGRHESICERKENIRSYDGRIREYFSQLNTKHSLAQNTGKRAPKHSKLVAHRKHGEGEGKDESGEEKNEKL